MTKKGPPTAIVDRPQFINRKEEMATLMKGLQSAKKGRGGMILIEGESGIGKTRLIEESMEDARSLGFRVLSGKCLDYRRSPYLPFVEMLRDYFGISMDRLEDESKDNLLRSIEMEFSSMERHKNEFLDFFFPSGEIIGGFRTSPSNEHGIVEELQMRGYRTIVFGNADNFEEDPNVRKGITLLPIEDEKREGLSPRRIERTAVRIKEAFENNKHCALIFNGIDIIAGANPKTKLKNLIAIVVDIAMKNRGVLVFSTEDPKRSSVDHLQILDISKLETDEQIAGCEGEPAETDANVISIYELLPLFFKEVSNRDPALVVIEDLQWGEKATYNLIQFLARDAKEEKLLILGSYRSEEFTIEEQKEGHMHLRDALQRMSREHLFTTMTLGRFDKERSSKLAATILGHEMDIKELGSLFRTTEGNPRFILDFVRDRIEKSFPTMEPAPTEQVTGEDLISKRINSLAERDRNVLEMSAVLGEDITIENMQRVLGMEIDDILDSMDSLMELKFLIDKEVKFEFEHPKVMESIYDSIDDKKKVQLHKMVCRAFMSIDTSDNDQDIPNLAIHHFRGEEFEKAFDDLVIRAKKLIDEYDLDRAHEILNMAVECLEKLDPDKENLMKLIDVLHMKGDVLEEKREFEEGLSVFEKAVEIADKNGIEKGLSISYRRIGDLLLQRYDWNDTMEYYLRSLHISKKEEDEVEVAQAFKGLGRIYFLKGDYHRSMECYIKYMENPETRSGPANVRGISEMGDIYYQMGDFNQALAYYKLAIKKGEEGDIKNETSLAYVKMADVLLKLGEVEDSRRFAELAREFGHSTETSTATLETLLEYTKLMLEVGELDKAEEAIKELDGSIDGMDRLQRAFAFRIRGVLLSRQRDFKGSISQMKAAVKTLEELQVPYHLALTYFHFGLIRFQQMDVEGALEMLEKASGIFKEIKSMYYLNRTSSKLREVSFIREVLRA